VLLEFDAPASGPVTREQRGIELRDVSKGTYRLTVVISDPASGTTVTRTQTIPSRGALVCCTASPQTLS